MLKLLCLDEEVCAVRSIAIPVEHYVERHHFLSMNGPHHEAILSLRCELFINVGA
jgi:hypothetical protein